MDVGPARSLPAATGDEREVLAGWLEWERATVVRKCAGLSDELAYATPLATSSSMSIAAVVSHLTATEYGWFERSFLGSTPAIGEKEVVEGWRFERAPLADLLTRYDEQCERSRRILAGHPLDALEAYAPPGMAFVSLRWIATHMIEETARHAGQLDILRELLDGTRGY